MINMNVFDDIIAISNASEKLNFLTGYDIMRRVQMLAHLITVIIIFLTIKEGQFYFLFYHLFLWLMIMFFEVIKISISTELLAQLSIIITFDHVIRP